MSQLTRDALVKSIVAEEIRERDTKTFTDSSCYCNCLKTLYHKWEHVSSDELCERYNQLFNLNISTDQLAP